MAVVAVTIRKLKAFSVLADRAYFTRLVEIPAQSTIATVLEDVVDTPVLTHLTKVQPDINRPVVVQLSVGR